MQGEGKEDGEMLTEEDLWKLTEKMGEAVHIAWMEKRKKEKGWHAPEKCPGPPICPTCNGTKEVTTPLNTGGSETHKCATCSGKGRVPCIACHPCMVPYKDLPDSEKELDRRYPIVLLRILNEMGYEVVSKNDLEAEEKSYELDRKTIKGLLAQRDRLANDLVRANQRLGEMEVDAFKPPCERQNCCCYLNPAYDCPKRSAQEKNPNIKMLQDTLALSDKRITDLEAGIAYIIDEIHGHGPDGKHYNWQNSWDSDHAHAAYEYRDMTFHVEKKLIGLGLPIPSGNLKRCPHDEPIPDCASDMKSVISCRAEGKICPERPYSEKHCICESSPPGFVGKDGVHCGNCGGTVKPPGSKKKHYYCPECKWEVSAVGHREGCKFGSDMISKIEKE
jgi:hypothetical protein